MSRCESSQRPSWRATPLLTAPNPWYVLGDEHRALDPVYWEFEEALMGGRAPLQVLGNAKTEQGEDPCGSAAWNDPSLPERDDWRVLFNIPWGYEDLSFGDGATLAIVIPTADLALGRYDRLLTDPSTA